MTTSGEVNLRSSMWMPFGSGEVSAPEPTESVEVTPEPTAVPTPDKKPSIEIAPTPAVEEKEETSSLIPFIIGGVVVLVIIVTVVLVVLKKKKNKQEEKPAEPVQKVEEAPKKTTVILDQQGTHSGGTQLLWGNEAAAPQSFVQLTDVSDPQKTFRVPIVDKVTIGRVAPADIVLDFDQAVSSKHCEIVKKGGLYYLVDTHSSNGTEYNGARIMSETPIISGGVIGIGRGKYKVTLEG